MKITQLQKLFEFCHNHREEHQCGGYPYEHGDVLTSLVAAVKPKRVLEVGTGLGYTTACIVHGFSEAIIDTIDQDPFHSQLALDNWEELGITSRITQHIDKAEAVLLTLHAPYDVIFFDGYAPSMKFMIQYEKLLKKGGVLMTANLFVKVETGGKYVRELKREWKWQSGFFADTAISIKLR